MAIAHVRQTEGRLAALRLEQRLGRDSIRNCKSSKLDRSSIGHRNQEVRHGQRGSREVLRSREVRRNLGVRQQEGNQLQHVSGALLKGEHINTYEVHQEGVLPCRQSLGEGRRSLEDHQRRAHRNQGRGLQRLQPVQ
jgi:hypothetical protein